MRYLHFIWDFDGTLFDSYPRIARAFRKALADLGYIHSYEESLRALKVTMAHAAEVLAPGCPFSELEARYHIHAEAETPETLRPYPGAAAFLAAAVRAGADHCLYTHRGKSAVEALERERLLPLFRDIVTGEDGFPLKPAPDALLALIRRNDFDPARCLMVGDRDIDIRAGSNAGIDAALFDADGFLDSHENAVFRFSNFPAMGAALLTPAPL